MSFPERPVWVGEGLWEARGDTLWLLDRGAGKILKFDKHGSFLGRVSRPGQGELEFTLPLVLRPAGEAYLLLDGQSHFLWLDNQLKPLRGLWLEPGRAIQAPGGEAGVKWYGFPEFLVAGDELWGMALLERAGGPWRGYVRARLQPLEILEFLAEVPAPSIERDYLGATRPALAVAGGRLYALRYTQPPSLAQLTPERRGLKAFPAGFAELPALPAGGPEVTVPVFAKLAASSVPRFLLGRKDSLYLVTHRLFEGAHRWEVTEIQPREDRVVRTLVLPVKSPHLLVVPGPQVWAILERGAVTGVGQQETGALFLLPTAWLEGPGPSPLEEGKRVECK